MGLYDIVTVHYPLPDVGEMPRSGVMLQTKSFDCQLESYMLTVDGRLLRLTDGGWGKRLREPIEITLNGEFVLERKYLCQMVFGRVVWIKMIDRKGERS